MFRALQNYEWSLISQLLLRMYSSETYDDFVDACLRNLKGIMTFEQAVTFQASMVNDEPILASPRCMTYDGTFLDNSYYIKRGYKPEWAKYLYCPWCSVFRYSDICEQDTSWVESRIFKEVLEPQNLYYGLYTTLVYKDRPIGAVVIWRSKEQGDFTERERYIMETLKEHLALQLSRIIDQNGVTKVSAFPESLGPTYNLTARETEVAELIVTDLPLQEISENLFIALPTLHKHINNIYRKTGIHSRRQLQQLWRNRQTETEKKLIPGLPLDPYDLDDASDAYFGSHSDSRLHDDEAQQKP